MDLVEIDETNNIIKVEIEVAKEDEIPDGGYAWVIMLSTFLVHVIVLGIQYSFGVFETFLLLEGVASSGVLAFIGTLGSAMMPAFGLISGRLAEKFGFRTIMFIGNIVLTLGLLLASFGTQAWHLFLTQGFLFGVGSSMIYFPAIALPSQWFSKKRGAAMGIAVAGAGIGGFIFSPVCSTLLGSLGYAWTMRILAIIAFVVLSIAILLAKTRIKVKGNSKTDWSLFRNPKFLLLFSMGFFATFGFLVPIYYIPAYGLTIGLTPANGALIISIANAASALGRIVLGFGADTAIGRINSLGEFQSHINIVGINIFIPVLCMLVGSLSILLIWPFSNSFGTLTAFGCIYTFSSGGFVSLFPVVIAELFGVEKLASIVGLLYSSSAIGNLAGAPLAGVIVDNSGFLGAMFYSGFLMMGSVFMIIAVRLLVEKKILRRV
ncbi:hypothetical protein HK096_003252 [Nowakowskiella sp. JEL0078]|nr:hypothetical protein HK096_003252 [Nowakowskiella sp. JEL0078]